jgi:signal transduction histidine kinase
VQAEGTYSRQYQGTGLGLAICIGLAEQMGASIKIDSVETEGTTVSILLKAGKSWVPAVGTSARLSAA